MNDRKSIKFYKSYYEVAKELPKKLQAEFVWAILRYQFEGIEPEFTGMLKIVWISQKHSLDKQIEGFINATKELTPTDPPKGVPLEGAKEEPDMQGKRNKVKGTSGKEQGERGKEEEKKIPPFEEFSNYAFDQEEKLSIEIDQAKLKAKYLSWVENGWKTGKGTKIKNWKSTLLNTINYLKKEKGSAEKEKKPTHSEKILGKKFYNEIMESLNPNTDDGFTPLKKID